MVRVGHRWDTYLRVGVLRRMCGFECSKFNVFPRGFPLRILAVILIGATVFGALYVITEVSSIQEKTATNKKAGTAALASDYVEVLITTSRSSIVGAFATAKSIIANTKHPVQFYFIASSTSAPELHSWIERSILKDISYIIKIFNPEKVGLNITSSRDEDDDESWIEYAKYYIPRLLPQVKGILISLDPDVIVQGDISELQNVSIAKNSFGAVSKECDAVSRFVHNHKNFYYQVLNMNSPHLKEKNIDGKQCIFSLGVMVLNMTQWVKEDVSTQLDYWYHLNEREPVFHAKSILPPFLIVFYNRTSPFDGSWHVRHLGMSRGTRYSRSYIEKANLLQWDGHFKPWKHRSAFSSFWAKYLVPKPSQRRNN